MRFFHPRLAPLTLALQLGLPLALSLTIPPAQAQTHVQRYDLPAGPLGESLNRLASQAGIALSFDANRVRDLRAPALQGSYSLDEAFAHLLEGSGLEAQGGKAGYVLVKVPSVDAYELGATTISGKAPGSITEDTGSYTTAFSSSSTRLNLTPQETPQTVTVLTRQRLDDQRLENITDALDATPGITVVREGVGADNDSFWSRGFQINNYEIDGVPTASSLGSYRSSTVMYDRVEIVRGATGLISGLGTPSATINLIRKRPTEAFQLSWTGQTGNWERYGSGVDVSGPLNVTGTVRGRFVTDYKTQHSWIDRYKSETRSLYGITELDLSDDTLLTLGFSHLLDNVNAPLRNGFPLYYSNGKRFNFKRRANSSPDWSYYDSETDNFFGSIEHHFNNGWSGKLELSHTGYRYAGLVTYLGGSIDPTTGAGTYIAPTLWTASPKQDSVDMYFTGPFSLMGRDHELITGVTLSKINELDTKQYDGWLYPGSGYDGSISDIRNWSGAVPEPTFAKIGENDTRENQHAAYLTSRLHITDATSLIFGSRLIDWKRTIDRTSESGEKSKTKNQESGVFIPYAGIVYALNDNWSLYSSYTKIFNPQGYWVRDKDNSSLAPEEGTSYEVGIKGAFNQGRLTGSLALFNTEQDNLAIYNLDSASYISEQGASTNGVELEFNGELSTNWQISAGYSYTFTEDVSGQRIVTHVPQHSIKTFSTYRLPAEWSKFTVGGGVNWQSKTGYDLATYTQGSYALVNLMARYDITDHLSTTLNLNNLLDKEYFSGASSYGVYGAPRNLMLTTRWKF